MRNWRAHAACRGMETELFFPVSEVAGSARVRRAKAVCESCPVRDACLAEALAARDVHGVRGGMTGPEREAAARGGLTSFPWKDVS